MTAGALQKLLIAMLNSQDDGAHREESHSTMTGQTSTKPQKRIDSGGHHEEGSLQVVCQFVTFWKNDNEEFKRAAQLICGISWRPMLLLRLGMSA